jgi:hypothetical protein
MLKVIEGSLRFGCLGELDCLPEQLIEGEGFFA